jgi:predicted heme/steroid binding protein/uncharacterized membrane protein/ActR/RegA family two-component response regulator
MEHIRVLLVEDNPGDARLVLDMLAEAATAEYSTDWQQTLADGLKRLGENTYDVVLLDLGLPDSPHRSMTFTRVEAAAPTVPIIVMTGLDDEVFAVTTVRRGAQDYLVKGKIDSDTLARTIRYAVARKLGGLRQFSLAELARHDGKEGRAAYLAFKGKVYDATGSRLWKLGKHGVVHLAGADLTQEIANAPHGEQVLARLPILGDLAKEEAVHLQWLRKLDSVHPHITLNHVTIAYTLAAPFTFAAWMVSGLAFFDQITLYLIVLGLVAATLGFSTGMISWVVNYESKASRVFNLKIANGMLLFFMLLSALAWRLTGPETVLSRPGSFLYLTALLVPFVLVLVLDYNGKKIVYS